MTLSAKGLSRDQIAWRLARDIPEGWFVNLGIGMPEKVANHLDGREVIFHSENGILGMGPTPPAGQEDPQLINAGKKPITALPGASFFDHAWSFGIVRGGHLDLCVLGAYQVAANGDIANWARSADDPLPAIGGAMDLAAGAKRIFVMMDHVEKSGAPRLLERCAYPLTGAGVVRRVYTSLAVVDVTPEGFVVREIVPGVSPGDLQAVTGARLAFAPDLGVLEAPAELAAPAPDAAAPGKAA
ncbi:MAG: 3-oxoacid CoA-transferase subunit B [Pseudomonadota bacterium]|nr:3-oxoacid CoA-transferase subunit B [Pseudomonadota bacterium]MEE3101402.1 3-oxoacid CoA-transferase subunit B [Pseudomonadota bacterium]